MARYHKSLQHFHGLRAAAMQQLFKEFYRDEVAGLASEVQFELSVSLLGDPYSECKQCAALLLQRLESQLSAEHLRRLEPTLDLHMYDWATCDSLSGRVFFSMVKREAACLEVVRSWKQVPNLWRQRASCVSFVKLGRHGQHTEVIFDICESTCHNPERFVQLGTGWVLREVSLVDLDRVVAFLKRNYAYISREGLRYAIEKMEPPLRKQLMAYGRAPPPEKRSRTTARSR
jgi:3-methyladenine DNA glycosylase AlkD